jgi:hypothetical protein
MNYQIIRMEFKDTKVRRVVLRGMNTNTPRIMSSKRMEVARRPRNTAWASKCVIIP